MDDDKCKMLFPYPRGVHGLLGLSNNSGNVSTEGSSSKGKKKKKERKERFAFETRSQVDILDDGYKWRKYGQKAVKNNRFPRGYYRCSHEGCDVKKQVQRLTRVNNRTGFKIETRDRKWRGFKP